MTLQEKIASIDVTKISDKAKDYIEKVKKVAETDTDRAETLIDGLIAKISIDKPDAIKSEQKLSKTEAEQKLAKVKQMKKAKMPVLDKVKKEVQKQYPNWDDDRVETLAKIRLQAMEDRQTSIDAMIENLEKTTVYQGKPTSRANIDYVAPKEPNRVMRQRMLGKDAKTSAITEADELRMTGKKFKRKSPTFGKRGGAKRPFYYEYRMNRRDVDSKIMLEKGGLLHGDEMNPKDYLLIKAKMRLDSNEDVTFVVEKAELKKVKRSVAQNIREKAKAFVDVYNDMDDLYEYEFVNVITNPKEVKKYIQGHNHTHFTIKPVSGTPEYLGEMGDAIAHYGFTVHKTGHYEDGGMVDDILGKKVRIIENIEDHVGYEGQEVEIVGVQDDDFLIVSDGETEWFVAIEETDLFTFAKGGSTSSDIRVPVDTKVTTAEIEQFIDYVDGFYGKDGIYAGDLRGGYTKKEIRDAVMRYLDALDKNRTWGHGDSFDREMVLQYLTDPKNDMDVNQINLFSKGGNVPSIKREGNYLMGYEPYFEKDVRIASVNEEDKVVRPTHGYFPNHPLAKKAIAWAKRNGYEYVADGNKYAKGGMTLQSIAEKYSENEDENAHSENVVLLAEHFGTPEELKEAKTILKKHNSEGFLSSANGAKRRELHLKLLTKARAAMKRQGVQFAKGGEVSIPNAEKMFHLPMEMAVYVPSTYDVDKKVTRSEMNARITEVEKYLAETFGGFTSSEKEGGYLSSKNRIVTEKVVPVTAFASKEDFNKKKGQLVNKMAVWAKKWGQEAIGFEFEGDLYYVPQKFKKGGRLTAHYIPQRDIAELKTVFGDTFKGKDLLDGAYAKRKPKSPKVVRTQFEEDTFEFAKGGSLGKSLYVPYSSIFDSIKYDTDRISKIVRKNGGTDIRLENDRGWSNQPEVVVFKGDRNKIKQALNDAFETEWIDVQEKDWRNRKYAVGGALSGNPKLMIEYISADVYEDDYEQGEGDYVNGWNHNEAKGTIVKASELVKWLHDNYNLPEEVNAYGVLDGRIFTSMMVDVNNSEASESEIQKWKEGKMKLYTANYSIGVKYVSTADLDDETISEMTGIGVYADGGSIKNAPRAVSRETKTVLDIVKPAEIVHKTNSYIKYIDEDGNQQELLRDSDGVWHKETPESNQPKMSRTMFEEETFEYAKGGKAIGFEKLSDKVAARYAGKSVAPEYQDEYGKRYDRSEAKEVGDKVAGKVYWAQRRKAKMAEGGEVGVGGTMDTSLTDDPMIGGTMASSMFAKGGKLPSPLELVLKGKKTDTFGINFKVYEYNGVNYALMTPIRGKQYVEVFKGKMM